MKDKAKKYTPISPVQLPKREWPNQTIQKAPAWCSVDLRDGNQALITPMTIDQKMSLFTTLIEMGFKEIEVGFPSAAEVEYNFLRQLIDQNKIPNDVSIQVLTQAREHLIKRTCESLIGVKNAIFHLYNSTSTNQRDIVFKKSKEEIKEIALQGIRWTKEYTKSLSGNITLEYSPESFTGTEIEFAIDICNDVINEWGQDSPIIINLPATVELFTPNVYADMIEYAHKNLIHRNNVILSVHTHNDRGTGVAASELALLAGADRVEGTLFGNGERTGNVDIITMALNLLTQGIDPRLKIDDINSLIKLSNDCTNLPVHPRHPYAGDLVFTAFSGSHQDAIKKGMAAQKNKNNWEVPYLPINPKDIGRSYEAIIRINSQSGKGGVAYILETDYGCILPKTMYPELGKLVQQKAEQTSKELSSKEIWDIFDNNYLQATSPIEFNTLSTNQDANDCIRSKISITINDKEMTLEGTGNGPIDATKQALSTITNSFKVNAYNEHSLREGSSSKAIAYIQIEATGTTTYGAGIDANINIASIKALISAINRAKLVK